MVPELVAAKEVLAVIYHKLHIDITDEVYYLTQHLISSKKFLTTNFMDENEEYEFKKEIQAILYRIREDTNVDLSDDTQLINGLAVHLSVAVQRLRFHMNIRNDFLDYMKNIIPLHSSWQSRRVKSWSMFSPLRQMKMKLVFLRFISVQHWSGRA